MQSRPAKYLLYAIGEIFLVVIGILIALQINNWNDNVKTSKAELAYYHRIKDDFDLDQKVIQDMLKEADNRIKVSRQLLLDLDSGTKDKNYILNEFLLSLRSDAYVPRDVTFKDLVSSGNLKVLADVSIKNSLIQYYSELENLRSQLEQNRGEKIKRSFDLVNSPQFGMHEFNYMRDALGLEVLEILPQDNWVVDKQSKSYKDLQLMLLFNTAMAVREKQHLKTIQGLMEKPYKLLEQKCNENR